MAAYRMNDNGSVVRLSDRAVIPADTDNADYAEFLAWKDAGNTPDPAAVYPKPDPIDSWDILNLRISFNHENRIRALEGKQPVTVAQFKAALKALN